MLGTNGRRWLQAKTVSGMTATAFRRRLLATLYAGLAVCALAAKPAPLAFDSFQIDTGHAQSQTVLHGALLNDGNDVDEILVFGRHDDGTRSLDVYAFDDGRWQLAHNAQVDEAVIFADTLELGGEDRLLLYRRGHIDWLDTRDWQRKPLLAASSVYNVPAQDVPLLDIGRDVDGDNRHDIAVPDFDGYWLWLQRPDGSFGERNKLLATPTGLVAFNAVTYRPRDLYALDYDGDNATDLAVWEKDRLLVYRGDGNGDFGAEPIPLSLPIEVEGDEASAAYTFGEQSSTTILYDVKDYNGDGVADIVSNTVDMDGLFDQATRYQFYFGRRRNGATIFDTAPATAISSDRLQAPFDKRDLNDDGKIDFGMGSIDIGVAMLLRLLLTGTLRFDLDFYVMEANAVAERSSYPATPNVTRPIRIRFSLSSGSVLSGNWVEVGDANGDGLADLYVRHDESRIDIYPGVAGEQLFAQDPTPIAVALPEHRVGPENVDVDDLNGDGRDDLVILYPARADIDEPTRVGIVLSR